MKLTVFSSDGTTSSEKEFAGLPTFEGDKGLQAVKEVIVAINANNRQGTHSTKTRGEVRGGGNKPWRQKGTGRARSGKASSPLWRGGGVIFGNSPDENFTQKVNRKMYRAGMAAILSQLVREDRLQVVDEFKVDTPKTRQLAQKVKGMGLDEVLVITDQLDDNLELSSRNLPNVLVLDVRHTNPISLVRFKHVLLTKGAVSRFEEMWG